MMQRKSEKTPRQVMICQGINCRRESSPALMARLQQVFSQDASVEVARYLCFGACAAAPTVVVRPDRLWYAFAMPACVDDVVAAIRCGAELPGLANPVRPDVMEAVCRVLACRGTPVPDSHLARALEIKTDTGV